MITAADVNVLVGRRKLEILMANPIWSRLARSQAILSMMTMDYTHAQAEKFFDDVASGKIKNVCIGESNAAR